MTCIVGLQFDGKVYIGGDSAGVAGLSIETRADPKVFKNGPFVMGFTSSFRMGQLLRFGFKPKPKKTKDITDYQYLCTSFVDQVRKTMKSGGMLETEKGIEECGTFIVSYNKKLYYVEDDFQVGIPANGYCAVGCGHDLALGSVFTALRYGTESPIEIIKDALDAASEYSAGVRAPYLILDEKGKQCWPG